MILAFIVSFIVTFLCVPVLIRKFKEAGITGKDVNKAGKPDVPEMGGMAIIAGFAAGAFFAIAVTTLMHSHLIGESSFIEFSNLAELFAAISTILIVTIIGIFDDLVSIRHSVKALLPLLTALPLVAVAAGHPYITIPFLGQLYLPIIYPLILIPLAVAVVSNLTNMLRYLPSYCSISIRPRSFRVMLEL